MNDGSRVDPKDGIRLLRRQQTRAEELLSEFPLGAGVYDAWQNSTREYLIECFGSESENVRSFLLIYSNTVFLGNPSPAWWQTYNMESLIRQARMLDSCIDQLEARVELITSPPQSSTHTTTGSKVFVVHGRNHGARESVARLLERLGLEPIVLDEQPGRGRTIIEKFEDYSHVGFAVVLLTGDDRGGLHDQPYETQKPRARQNVILELGFFIGKLGRDHVCALYESGVEIPSDYQAVEFIEFDQRQAWRHKLASEMKAAGLPIDMNDLFKQ